MRFFPRGAFNAETKTPVQTLPAAQIQYRRYLPPLQQFQNFQPGVMPVRQPPQLMSSMMPLMPLPLMVPVYQPTPEQFAQIRMTGLRSQELYLKQLKLAIEQNIKLIEEVLHQAEEPLSTDRPQKRRKASHRLSRSQRVRPLTGKGRFQSGSDRKE
ncbi:MAG: hypothetical protein JXA46_03795 [Dehalococcoidales bacterium]|nr:hypothetical protein [Dehalococcoidales bacterium]